MLKYKMLEYRSTEVCISFWLEKKKKLFYIQVGRRCYQPRYMNACHMAILSSQNFKFANVLTTLNFYKYHRNIVVHIVSVHIGNRFKSYLLHFILLHNILIS